MVCHRTLPGLHDLNNIRENHSRRCMPSIKITLFEITPRSQENIPFIWMVKGCKIQANAMHIRHLYHTIPAVTRDLGFCGLNRRTAQNSVSFYDKQRALMTYCITWISKRLTIIVSIFNAR